MKVKLQKGKELIQGELSSSFDRVYFISEDKSVRIFLERPNISICGEEDDNAIWIRGDEQDGTDSKFFRKADYTFFPYHE
jgi:hypothetical protein